jgi:hypothetical protein
MSTIQFRSIQLKIHQLTNGVGLMAKALESKLYHFSDGKPIQCKIPEDFADDLASTSRGDSWISHAQTVPREHALLHHIASGGSCKLVEVTAGNLKWNSFACHEFMCRAASIIDLIATLVHIGAGPPCRGTEQMEDQISNGVKPRTVYLNFGRLLTVRRHTKNTHASGLDAFNICFYPKILTELITYYLLVVRPLERAVAEYLYGAAAAGNYDVYLYVKHGERMSSEQFSDVLQQVTKDYLGVSLGLNPLRHIIIAFQREYVEESRVSRGDNIGDLLSAHSSKTADKVYAREHGFLEGMTSHYLLDVREWCEQYHDAIGLGAENFPLIPLRTKRKLTRELASASQNPSENKFIKSLLDAVQKATFSSVVEHLQPFIRKELQANFAESCTNILVDITRASILQRSSGSSGQRSGATKEPAGIPDQAAQDRSTESAHVPLLQTPQPPAAPASYTPLPPTLQPSQEPVAQGTKRPLTDVYQRSGVQHETPANKRQNTAQGPGMLELSLHRSQQTPKSPTSVPVHHLPLDPSNSTPIRQPPSEAPAYHSTHQQLELAMEDIDVDVPLQAGVDSSEVGLNEARQSPD